MLYVEIFLEPSLFLPIAGNGVGGYTRNVMSDGLGNVESLVPNSLLLLTWVFTLQDKSGAQAGGTRSPHLHNHLYLEIHEGAHILSQTFYIPSHITSRVNIHLSILREGELLCYVMLFFI